MLTMVLNINLVVNIFYLKKKNKITRLPILLGQRHV